VTRYAKRGSIRSLPKIKLRILFKGRNCVGEEEQEEGAVVVVVVAWPRNWPQNPHYECDNVIKYVYMRKQSYATDLD
jgi:hypothetical protein